MTTLLLVGGHRVEVKTPAEEVDKRLSDAGWTTTWHQTGRDHTGALENVPEYSYVQPSWATFEAPKGRTPVRVRTDAVLAIL